MNITVYRYKISDPEIGNQLNLSAFYASRDFIEQLKGSVIVEDDYLVVDESDLDSLGRIPIA